MKTHLALLTLVLSLAGARPAAANAIGINGTTLIFIGTNGNDVVTGARVGPAVTLFEAEPIQILTPACVAIPGGVSCQIAGIDLLAVLGEAGDDVLDMGSITGLNVFLSGGNGDDILIGGTGADILKGGAGDDVLIGGPGHNVLFGGPGNNLLLDGEEGDIEPPDPTLPGATEVPEPVSLVLLGSGLAAILRRRRVA